MINILGSDIDFISVTFAQALTKRNKAEARLQFGDSRLVFYVAAVEVGRAMVEHREGIEVVSRKAVEAILGLK